MSYYHLRIHQAFDFDGGTGVSNGHPPPLRWAPIVMVSRECLRVLRNIREFQIGNSKLRIPNWEFLIWEFPIWEFPIWELVR